MDQVNKTNIPSKPTNVPGIAVGLPAFHAPTGGGGTGFDSGKILTSDEMFAATPTGPRKAEAFTANEMYIGDRFEHALPGENVEETAARQQSAADRWANGIIKGVGLGSTTFLQGTIGFVYGIGSMLYNGRGASFYDNSLNNVFAKFNDNMEDWLPNYYAQAEKDASWYSTKNIWTANFWSDKVIKNLGYSVGTLAAGGAWGAALRAIGVTSKLVSIGKGMETAQALDDVLVNAPKAARFGEAVKTIESLGTKYVKPLAGRALTNSERIFTSVSSTFGEASIEAHQNMNQYRDMLINEYFNTHGYYPTGTDLEEINDSSEKVGNYTWLMNTLLLTATTYIQLPKILNSSRTLEKRQINSIIKEEVADGAKIAEKVGAKYKQTPSLLESIAGKPGRFANKYLIRPASLFFSPSEAIEEGMQYAIQTGVEDFFKSGYDYNEDVSDFWNGFTGAMGNVLTTGIRKTLTSKEGMEGFLIGGISGGIQTSFSPFGDSDIKRKGLFGEGGYMSRNTQAAIAVLNGSKAKNLSQALVDGVKYMNIAINAQQKRQAAIVDDDKLAEKDYEHDYAMTYILPRVKYGKYDSIKQEIDLYKEAALTEQGFNELKVDGVAHQNETKEQFIARLNEIQNTADSVNKTYEMLSDKYSAVLNDKGERVYTDDVIDKLAYAAAKVVNYDGRLSSLNAKLGLKGIVTDKMVGAIQNSESWKTGKLRDLLDDKNVTKEIDELLANVDASIPIEAEETKKDILDLADMIVRKKQYVNQYNEIRNAPQDYKDPELQPDAAAPVEPTKEQPNVEKKNITVKTKYGERVVQTNTEYLVGKIIEYDKNGNEVFRAPSLIILDENEDGTLKIRASSGRVKDIKKEELEDYSLTPMSTIQTNKKAAYMYKHWNSVFRHHGIKMINGKPAEGRLEYTPKKDRLMFVYKDDTGKIVRKEVWNTMFKAKKDYPHAMIYPIGTLTAEQQQAHEEFIAAPTIVSSGIQMRNQIITDLYEKSAARIEEINKTLEGIKERITKNRESLEEQTKALENETVKKRKNNKKITALTQEITNLGKLYTELIEEEKALTNEKSELEEMVPVFQDLLDNLQILPDEPKQVVEMLKKDISTIEDDIEFVSTNLRDVKGFIKDVEDAMAEAFKVLNDYIDRLKQANPDLPLFLDELQEKVEKFLGEEGARQYIADRLGFTERVAELQNDIANFQEEMKLPEFSSRLEKLNEQLKNLESTLTRMIGERQVRLKMLEEFEEFVERQKQEEEEELAFQDNQELRRQFIGTHDSSLQNTLTEKAYEPASKKSPEEVLRSTRPIDTGKSHQKRANNFGFRYAKFSEKKKEKIKGVIVTSKTEMDIIPGLTNYMLSDLSDKEKKKGYKPEEIVALVMVQENKDGSYSLIDEKGNVIPKGQNVLEKAIFQVFPLPDASGELVGEYKDANGKWITGSMFRDDVSVEMRKKLTDQYVAWRTQQLEQTSLREPEKISVSFGIAEYEGEWVKNQDGKDEFVRDPDARISAVEAGLISPADFTKQRIVTVSTANTISEASVVFNNAKGRVFLKVPGSGLTKLFNRKFSENEATTIFNVILQLSKNGVKAKKLTPESYELLNWLKSVVYWGIAIDKDTGKRKPAGYNNIWFEDVEEDGKKMTKLFISGLMDKKSDGYAFTPTALEDHRADIIYLITQLYHNTNNHLTNEGSWKKPYFQIIGIDKEGNAIKKQWPNYQTYLLSSKTYDDAGNETGDRNKEEIPLITQFKKLRDEDDTNRNGIYFTLSGPTTEFDFSAPAKPVKQEEEAKPAAEAAKPEAPAAPAAPVAKPEEPAPFKLNGEEEIIQISIGKIYFTMDLDKLIATNGAEGLTFSYDSTIADKLKEANPAITKEEIEKKVYDTIMSKTQAQINARIAESTPPIAEAAALEEKKPQAPELFKQITDIETKKADIERRRKEELNEQKNKNIKGVEGVTVGKGKQVKVGQEFNEGYKVNVEKTSSENWNGEGEGYTVYSRIVSDAEFDESGKLTKIANVEIEIFNSKEDADRILKEREEKFKQKVETFGKDRINAKYDAELSALEEKKSEISVEEEKKKRKPGENRSTSDNKPYRLQLVKEAKRFQSEDWKKLEEWFTKNFPNVPIYRVKNMIQATNGRQAWGMLHKGAIYIYENAEIGTAYHEVFEAVWNMFSTSEEKKGVIDEFRNREGSYTDRFTGEKVEYKNATDAQIKEEIAEEFRDFVQFNKAPKRVKGKSWIAKLFNELVQFIKEFFVGKNAASNVQKLFDKIGNGYYAKYNPYQSKLAYAQVGIIDIENARADENSDLRVKNVPSLQVQDVIQHMIFTTIRKITRDGENLFAFDTMKRRELYPILLDEILDRIDEKINLLRSSVVDGELSQEDGAREIGNNEYLFEQVQEQWDELTSQFEDYIARYGISFDENDELALKDDKAKEDPFGDARKIDSFRKANSAIKLLFGSLAVSGVSEVKTPEGKTVRELNYLKRSSIGGAILLAADQVHLDLQNKLHDSVTLDEMFMRLKNLAKQNPAYEALYYRLTKSSITQGTINYRGFKEHDFNLLAAFWKSMKKQNADVAIVYILPSGEVIVSDSALNSASKQAKREMFNKMVEKIKSGTKFFRYNPTNGKYTVTEAAKKYAFSPEDLNGYIKFMKELGVEFDLNSIKKLNNRQQGIFREAVERIRESISKLEPVFNTDGTVKLDEDGKPVDFSVSILSTGTLGIDKRMTQLGIIKAIIENPEFESTYFNINGERTQTYVGVSVLSNLHHVISKAENIKDLDSDENGYSAYRYLLEDVFAKNSVVLQRIFNIGPQGDGERISGTEDILKPVFVDGTIDEVSGKKKESTKQPYKQRLIQEITLNLKGIFYNLVPGDASIEHAAKLHDEDRPFVTDEEFESGSFMNIFKGYFMSEVELSRDNRRVVGDNKKTDLRFFKAILADPTKRTEKERNSLHDEIVSAKNRKKSPEALYKDYQARIEKAVKDYIMREGRDTYDLLETFDIINISEGELQIENIQFEEKEVEITKEYLSKKLTTLAANYIIANIEFHKLIYSDPYQYNDELKRIKNFLSPREALMIASPEVMAALHEIYNAKFKEGSVGYTEMNRTGFRAITFADVFSFNDELPGYHEPFEEPEGGGYITLKAYRLFKILASDWTDDNERQYLHDIRYEELVKSGASSEEIRKHEKNNPNIRSTYTPIKPIVAGSKGNRRGYNDIVLHKFALVPISYRMMHLINPESNMLKLHDKMVAENIDYGVFESGSKTGTEETFKIYDEEGNFNTAPFETQDQIFDIDLPQGVSNIPFNIVSIQSEVPSKDVPVVSQGTQITHLATMDYMEAGVPIDFVLKDKNGNDVKDFDKRFIAWTAFKTDDEKSKHSELYKEIINNKNLLEERIKEGFKTLIGKLGMKQTSDGFVVDDKKKLIDTLKGEFVKREINDNVIDAFEGFKNGDVVLEATPAYQQIRNILYSIADKNIASQKITGGLKVQIPSSFLESIRAKAIKRKTKKGKEVNAYSSSVLKFYEDKDGKRYCEIMIARWFDSKKTDEELMDYFNNTDEGKEQLAALMGVAFRIPTQKQNSIDVFRVAKFLPQEYGDSIVIPSALVKKAGSDFDIDKLSIYLKNVYEDAKGNIKVVPYFGTGDQAKNKLAWIVQEIINEKIKITEQKTIKMSELQSLFGDISLGVASKKEIEKWIPIFREWFKDELVDDKIPVRVIEEYFISRLEKLNKKLNNLTNEDIQEMITTIKAEKLYKQSLDNAYIQSLENLISHPLNFKNLIKPNSADDMKELSAEINKKLGNPEEDYSYVGNMMNRRYMTELRQAFVEGKYAIGIAARGQINHVQNQKDVIYVDPSKMDSIDIPAGDKTVLGYNPESKMYATNSDINFEHYNTVQVNGKKYATLSMIKDKLGKNFISDTIGMFIDGYVDISKGPWIMRLGATPKVTSTWLFLIKLGVPRNSVAYFMNQPIIRDYLKAIENNGYSWLFIEPFIVEALDKYEPSASFAELGGQVTKIPEETDLFKSIGKGVENMSDLEKAQQQFMLKEFLKYAKMASHLFAVSQGSNFDTATFNDPFLIFKKLMQLERARNTIISSVDKILESTFLNYLKEAMSDARDMFAEILISDSNKTDGTHASVREVLEAVLKPYIDVSDREFIKIAHKAVSDMFDWAMQNNIGLNTKVGEILLGIKDPATGKIVKESAAVQLMNFRDSILGNEAKNMEPQKSHPLYNNIVLKSMKLESGKMDGQPDNLYIVARESKVFDQNLLIYGFQEIEKYLTDNNNSQLYRKLIALAVLQSGLTNSHISFTSLLPYKDLVKVYNETLSHLKEMPSLSNFYTVDAFQRSNATNDDIVPFFKEKLSMSAIGNWYYRRQHFVDGGLKKANKEGLIPMIISMPTVSREGQDDFMVYSWEKKISKKQRIQARRTGDKSHIHKVLMKKIYIEDEKGRRPLVQISKDKRTGRIYSSYLYKAMNPWGDSFRGKEMYDKNDPSDQSATTSRASVLNNGFDKVEKKVDTLGKQIAAGEMEDVEILKYYTGSGNFVRPSVEFNKLPSKSDVPTMTYAGIGSRETPEDVKEQMTEMAKYLESLGYTLNTGLNEDKNTRVGADRAFDKGATKKNLFGTKDATERTIAIAKELHPNPAALGPLTVKYMARNTNQIFGANLDTPVDFVLCWTPDGATSSTERTGETGGTGQAIDMASRKGIPVINMANENWREQLNAALKGEKIATKPTLIREYTPKYLTRNNMPENGIFVFGSNEGSSKGGSPTHGKGSALIARQQFGAIQGQPRGLQGRSYGIVTKKYWDVLKSSTPNEIQQEIEEMLEFAKSRPDLKFYVTKIGSENAGYTIEQMKELFQNLVSEIPDNVILPIEYEVRGAKSVTPFDVIADFTPEQKSTILTNFSNKYKLSREEALNQINEALQTDRQNTINKLKECY